ncbi:hypothetical protein MMC14_003490 [Varicellaria rhodocarpa]|nr:hypothetical protein [Varicellaria rhodocarpa]
MPAIDYSLLNEASALIKRQGENVHLNPHRNWAYRNPGIVLVFCIVFIVAVGLISLFIYRKVLARKARAQR